ncbi:hypothetical protein A4X09_0g5202 [Tilletia walkeri]|uniref:UBA domain-containing protein n=1 Tax=Tilletia walkeri TaxID=117179 RepID=A0A8X7N6Z5_9BASI|nr:hypothetical protein A4X09_0g5202 [Tilletia walkeri]
MKITKSKKLAPATPELTSLLARIAAVSDDDLPEVLDNISEWCWPRGDLHYWIATLNRFDTILEKICKDYEVAKVQTNEFTPLCKKLLLSVLRFSRLLIENCTNRKLYASYEHLNDLLLTRDIDVLEATLRFILRPAQQRSSSSHSSRNEPNISQGRLASLAVIWPTTRGASDMVALCKEDAVVPQEASDIHFSFYRASSSSSTQAEDASAQPEQPATTNTQTPARPQRSRTAQANAVPVTPANPAPTSSASAQRTAATPAAANASSASPENGGDGLVFVDIPASDQVGKSPMDIFADAVERFSIPESEKFDLFQRIRVATGLSDPKMRQKMIGCRLLSIACYAHIVSEHSANSQLFLYERELVAKTANMLEPDNRVPQEVKAAAIYALDAMGRYRTKLAAVLNSVQASVSHGLLVRVLRELVEELSQPNPPTSDMYVDSVFGFTAFLSSIPAPTGNGMAMSSAVLPLLIKLVATPDPDVYMVQRTITRAVGLIDSIISTQPNAYATYTNAHGVETLVSRIHAEVERDSKDFADAEAQALFSADPGSEDSPYGTLPFGRASLLRHILKSILHDLQGAGTPDSLRTLLDSTLLQSVKCIMENRKLFGPQIFAMAINIMATFVHNEPTALTTIQENKLSDLFLDCIEADIESHFEVIMAIPNAIGALSLNQTGLDMFTSRPIIAKLLSLFTSERHIKVLQDEESAASFGSAVDELVRHQPSMKDAVFAGINAIFDRILEVGSSYTPPEHQRAYYSLLTSTSTAATAAPTDVEMATADQAATGDGTGSSGSGSESPAASDEEAGPFASSNPSRTSEEHTVLSYIKAMARFLEMLFQTPHHCKDFLKSDGLTKLLSLYSLPCLPADFYNHLAGDALVQLVRFIADASPNTVFQALFKDIKIAIEAVPLDFQSKAPGASQLVPNISATDEATAAKSNELYRKSISLCMRIHLLADCLHTYNVPGHKLPSGFLSSLFSSSESKSLELADMGYQFRFWTWEYLQLTAAKADRLTKKDAGKDSSADATGADNKDESAASAVAGGAQTSVVSDKPDGVNDIPDEAIDGPSTSKKASDIGPLPSDPESANLDVWQEMSGAISTTIRDFFQELTRLLSPRRSSEASNLRRYAPNAMEQIAQALMSYFKWAEEIKGNNDFAEIGYYTIVTRHTMALLYDERTSVSSRTQTHLIFKFSQLEGFQALFRLYERFSGELTKHFDEEKPDQSGQIKHALKFHHICGALRILLSLFQNLIKSKLLHESAHTAQLVLKEEPKSSANYFEPADFLLKVRAQVLGIMGTTTTSNWLQHLPVSVNRLVIQILLEILRGEGEAPVVSKKDEAQAVQDRFSNSILSSLNSATALRRATAAAATANDAQVCQLADMGFPRAAARHALLRTNNDITAATEYLILHPDVVTSMPDDPNEAAAPSGAAAAEASSSNGESSAAGTSAAAAAPAATDPDVAMEEAISAEAGPSTQASGSNGKAPETKSAEKEKEEEKDQPFTDAGMAAKEKLDKEREDMRGYIFQRTLDLANHHEDLVFEVRDAFKLVSSDKSRANNSIQAVLGIILSAGPAAFGDQEKPVSVRMHAMAVIFNEHKLFKTLDDETIESAMGVCMVLIQDYESRPKQDAHPTWFASNLLAIGSLLSLECDVIAPTSPEIPEEDQGPLALEKVLPNFERFASERSRLLQYCLYTLKQPATLKKDGLLAVYRILVHLTRRRSIAVEFLKSGGLQLLFQPFRTLPAAEIARSQGQALIILRNVVEDADTLRVTMEQELQAWLSLSRSKTTDISTMTRQLAHVILRDPEMFLSIARDRLEMSEWSALKDNGTIRYNQPEAPAASAIKPVIPEHHDADVSFGAPASPTKGAHEFDIDASMHELGTERVDAKVQVTSETAENVIYFLLSELYKSTKDTFTCRKIVPQAAKAGAATASATKPATAPSTAVVSTGQSLAASQVKTSEGSAAEGDTSVSPEKAQQDASYLFSCFLMQTLMELLSSYTSCKLAFTNLCRRRSTEGQLQPRLKVSMLQYFLYELIPAGFIPTDDHEELRKRMAHTNLAMSVIVALTADVSVNMSIRETSQELVNVRRFVLDGITKALREAVSSAETVEVRYGRIYAQSELCHRLLTARPNVSAGKPAYDGSLHMAKTMLEKHFVTVFTTTLGEIDLQTPSVKLLLDTILRPLEHLTKAAIKMGKAERKAKEEGENIDDMMSSEESETESELSALEEEALLERDQRQETPDFYRNSSLGMHTGEMEQQPSYTDEEMEDEDEMDEDDVDMGEYDSEEEGSDLTTDDEEEVDIEDMSADEMSDSDSDDEGEDDDDDMDDDEEDGDDEDDEDGDSWATEDEEEEGAEEDVEGALDFVLGEGDDGEEVVGSGVVGEFMDDIPLPHRGIHGHEGMDDGEGEDNETEEDALSAEEPYDIEEFAHLEFADELAAASGRGQADDRFGANWGWTSIPAQQLARNPGGPSQLNATTSRSRRRLAMLDQALHGGHRPAPTAENAAYHPLLEQSQPTNSASRTAHSHRNSRRLFGGLDGRHDPNAGFMHSFEEMMGTGTMQFLENLVGMAPADAAIRIDVSAGPGGMGHFRVDGDSAVLEQLFGRDMSRHGHPSVRSAQKPEDPVTMAQQFTPLLTAQRWTEAARIVHGSEILERSQRTKKHVINLLFPGYKRRREEEERKREEEQEMRRKNLEAKAKAKDIEEKMSQSLTLTGQDSTSGSNTPADVSADATALHATSGESSATIAQQSTEASQSDAQPADTSEPAEGNDVEMSEGDHGHGTATPRASTPRPAEAAASSTAVASSSTVASGSESNAAPSSAAAPPAQERQFIQVHGQRIDITDTGIDPTFLEALPDDMREEVLNQHFRERRAAATTAAAANSNIAREFLEALPPEIRAEVIQQEALENARRRVAEANAANGANAEDGGNEDEEGGDHDDEGGPEGMDAEALLASLNPALRNSVLPEELFAGLQNSLGRVAGSRRRHHRAADAGADAAAAVKKPPPRDAIQLLDKGGVATLVRLLFYPDMNGRKNGLYNILSNLSENSKTRADVLNLLLSILSDGTTDPAAVDRSFASMSIRASRTAAVAAAITPNRPTPKRSASGVISGTPGSVGSGSLLANSTTAPISVIGDEAPFLIATRVLESILHLTTVNEQAATFFLKDDARLIKKSGKGKDKEKADTTPGKAAGTAPLNTLLLLLKRPDILANAQLVDALLAVLNTVTRPLVSLQSKSPEATTSTAASQAAAARPAGDSTPQASTAATSSAEAASTTADATASTSAPAAIAPTAAEPAGQSSDLLEVPPQIAADRLAAVVRPLATPISSKGFQHTLSVASHLAAIDGARDTIGTALKTEAEAASKSLILELDRLLESLPVVKATSVPSNAPTEMDTGGDAPSAIQRVNGDASSTETESKFDSPALTALASPASAQAVFLRSLRALDYLMTGR